MGIDFAPIFGGDLESFQNIFSKPSKKYFFSFFKLFRQS